MRPTGWFQVAWSAEIAVGAVKPMHYFGHELVAFRTDEGILHVLDAHCRHLGAHLGYNSRVEGSCVVCPYHGWQWDGDGHNTLVPYQDKPTHAKMRSWPVAEQHGLVFLWHDPNGGPVRNGWEFPNVFTDFDGLDSSPDDFFPCYPNAIVHKPKEPIHPQLVLENSADCTHFRFAHGAPEFPILDWFKTYGTRWQARMSFLSPKTRQPALHLYNLNTGIGTTAAVFDSPKMHYRLVLTATPVDDDHSDIRVSYFYPRNGHVGDDFPEPIAAQASQIERLFEEDARIWRHQAFVQKPVYALDDRAGYSAMRTWCEQFYEAPYGPIPMTIVESADLR
jgi:3-ketosteroid 9alpha-monooxygenase subunit A